MGDGATLNSARVKRLREVFVKPCVKKSMSIRKIKNGEGWLVSLSPRINGVRYRRERIARGYMRLDGAIIKPRDHAVELQAELLAEIKKEASGARVEIPPTSRTIENWIELFFEKRYQRKEGNSRSTMLSRIDHFRKFCSAEGIRFIHQVTPRLTDKFWQDLDSRYKGRGSHIKFEAASTLINFAIQQGAPGVTLNPFRSVQRVQPEKNIDGRWLEDEEVDAILSAAQDKHEDAYLSYVILLETAMRRDELRNLPKSRIDFRNHAAKIDRYKAWRPKTERSRRHVPLSARATQAMRRLIEKYPAEAEYLLPSIESHRQLTDPRGENWLQNQFEDLRGEIIRRTPWMRAALEERHNGKHVLTLHSFRHTCLSRLLQEGVDVHTVGQIAGHSDAYITEIYAKFAKSNLHAAVSKLNARSLNNFGTESGTARIITLPKTGS